MRTGTYPVKVPAEWVKISGWRVSFTILDVVQRLSGAQARPQCGIPVKPGASDQHHLPLSCREAMKGGTPDRDKTLRFRLHRRYHVVGVHRVVVEERKGLDVRLHGNFEGRTER